jgi:hypothetical protein
MRWARHVARMEKMRNARFVDWFLDRLTNAFWTFYFIHIYLYICLFILNDEYEKMWKLTVAHVKVGYCLSQHVLGGLRRGKKILEHVIRSGGRTRDCVSWVIMIEWRSSISRCFTWRISHTRTACVSLLQLNSRQNVHWLLRKEKNKVSQNSFRYMQQTSVW